MRPLVVLDRIAPWTPPSGSELINVLLCDALSELVRLQSGMGIGSTLTSGLSTVHVPSVNLHGTPITLLVVSLSHLLCGSNLLISRALNTPSASPIKRSAPVVFHSCLVPIFILDSCCSWVQLRFATPTLAHRTGQTLVTVSCRAIFQMVSSRHDLSDTWT